MNMVDNIIETVTSAYDDEQDNIRPVRPRPIFWSQTGLVLRRRSQTTSLVAGRRFVKWPLRIVVVWVEMFTFWGFNVTRRKILRYFQWCPSSSIEETYRKLGLRMNEHRKELDSFTAGIQSRASRAMESSITYKSAITDHAVEENHVVD